MIYSIKESEHVIATSIHDFQYRDVFFNGNLASFGILSPWHL